jgi:sugar O-acyltransferase (sialic acid O-acetyltransferase NeuD family)
MEKLIIFPFNGNGLEALDCIQGQYDLIGFVDDMPEKQGVTKYGFRVYGRELINKYKEAKILAIPGSVQRYKERHRIIDSLNIQAQRFATIVHPKASVSNLASLGINVLIMAGVVITSNAVVSNHVCVLPNSVIHHDVTIGAWTLIGSNVLIAGNVSIGENCYISSGTNIIDGITIGNGTLIGLGTNLLTSTPINSKFVGNPGRLIL